MHHGIRMLPSTIRRGWFAVPILVLVLLVTACGASKGDLEKTQEELARAKTELSALAEKQQALEGKEAELTADLSVTQSGLTEVEGDLATLTTEAAALKGDLTKAQADVSTGSQNVSLVTSQLADLKNSFALTRDEVAVGRDKVEKLELAQASALKLARLSLIFDLYSNMVLVNSESDARASHLAIGAIVAQANDPGLVTRWNPLAFTYTRLFDGEFATAEEYFRAKNPQEDAFLTYLRTSQERVLVDWK